MAYRNNAIANWNEPGGFMEEIIAYFGQSHVDYLLSDTQLIRLKNAKADAWTANNLKAFDLYTKLLTLLS